MIKNTKTLWLAGALALAMPLSAWAAGNMGDMQGRQGMRHERMANTLDLTDAQKKQIKDQREETRKEMIPLFRQKRENMRKMRMLDPDSRNYVSEMKHLARKQGHLTEEMIVNMARSRAKFYSILTHKQKTKLKEMRKERRQMYRRRMGGGMQGRN